MSITNAKDTIITEESIPRNMNSNSSNSNNNNQRKPPPSSGSSTSGNPEFHHQPPPGVAPVPPSLDEALQGLVAAYAASQHQQPQQQQSDPSSKKRSFADMVNMMMQGQQMSQQAHPLPPFIQPIMPPHFAPFADIPPPPQMFGFIGSTSVEPPLPFSFSPNHPANRKLQTEEWLCHDSEGRSLCQTFCL